MNDLRDKRPLPRNLVIEGDAAKRLAMLPPDSVDCIVTSPPYFRLRNYEVAGQLGLEADVDAWVDGLREIAAELARVIVPTGTLWLNVGDAFSTHKREGAPRKSLLLGPERIALALIEDGWILRNKIVWAKTNTTPSSVTDRLSTKHEFVYLFSRSPKYHFDLHAIREPHLSAGRTKPRAVTASPAKARPAWLGPNSDADGGLVAMHRAGIAGHPLGKNPGDVWRLGVTSFRGGHFATFPESLVERMLLAGCPEKRCTKCRVAWQRPLERTGTRAIRLPLQPACQCNAAAEPGIALDPFFGSGTTGVVAERLNRDWLGIELSPRFVVMARDRLAQARPTSTTNRKEVA